MKKKRSYANHRSAEIGFNNRKAYKRIIKEVTKHSQYAQDARVEIERLEETIEEMPFDAKFKVVTNSNERIWQESL